MSHNKSILSRDGRALAIAGLAFLAGAGSTLAQGVFPPCDGLVFSTEEDFFAGNAPADGNPIVSDGDLLRHAFPGPGAEVCARNRDLLHVWELEVDLGLDGVDVLDAARGLIAFSTELDDPYGRFTAGDLLVTNGAVVPNAALLVRFQRPVSQDLGLDAIQFIGKPERILKVVTRAAERSRDEWRDDPGGFLEILEEYDVDLWFSTEGTGFSPESPSFLDGDLLSVATGTVKISNADFLPALPAGLPSRGVDFGLDAFTLGLEANAGHELFSTEIVSLDPALSFTDGDPLERGGGVLMRNFDLISTLEPLAQDLGLDALDFDGQRPCGERVEITEVGGVQVSLIHPTTGYARKMSGSSPPPPPPAPAPFDSPFGHWVSLRGTVPDDRCVDVRRHEYRLELRPSGGAWSGITTHPGWRAHMGAFCSALSWSPYSSDVDGWIPLAHYWRARACHPSHALNVWNTGGRDGLYEVRLTVRENGNPATETRSAPVAVTLDNTAPRPVQLTLYDAAGVHPLGNQCEVTGGAGDTVITIKGQVRDDGQGGPADGDEHFRNYTLEWTGGEVHTWNAVDPAPGEGPGYRYYDGGRPDLGHAGTEPPGATDVPLGVLNLTAEHTAATGHAPIKCGYTIGVWAYDRTILGGFYPSLNWVSDGAGIGWSSHYMQSFCFAAA